MSAVARQTSGARFRAALSAANAQGKPLQILGAVNAYTAMLARRAGAQAIYLSGSGVATASFGIPDLGITNLNDVVADVRRITAAVPDVPLLVDIDTGFGSAFGIDRTIRELIRAGAAAVHIEDQVANKRCGHRPGKQLVDLEEMSDRIRAAHAARADQDPEFVLMARTDALATEGLPEAVRRASAYVDAGADMIFAEACTTLEHYQGFRAGLGKVPILSNITEFGKTPLFTTDELFGAGANMVLYPLSAFRAQSKAALDVFREILTEGTQKGSLDSMQTRADLYETLDYHKYEQSLDKMFTSSGASSSSGSK